MAQTQQKKENEKKKLQKRKEKEQKREYNKTNNLKGSALEDMYAYVDEYGNISNVPSEKKYEFKESDLHRKEENLDEYSFGKVSYYNEAGKYGFIRNNETMETVYFNYALLGFELRLGDRVKFKFEHKKQGMQVKEVILEK